MTRLALTLSRRLRFSDEEDAVPVIQGAAGAGRLAEAADPAGNVPSEWDAAA